MLTRIVTGVSLIVFSLVFMIWGGFPLLVMVAIWGLLMALEIFSMLEKSGYSPYKMAGLIMVALGFLVLYKFISPAVLKSTPAKLFIVGLIGFYFYELISRKMLFPQQRFFLTLRVVVFIVCNWIFIYYLRETALGLLNVLYMSVLIWATDSFALFGGKIFGRHRLTSISPKKTIEGSLIAVLSVLIIALCVIFVFKLDWWVYLPAALLITALAQAGDLHESLTKRFLKVKDSSALLPGHGGFYDRLDSALFTAPILFYFFNW